MSGSRDRVLDAVRRGLAAGGGASAPVALSPGYRRAGTLARGALLDRFVERVEEYRARVIRAPAPELPQTLVRVLAHRGVRRLAAPPDLPPGWRNALSGTVELLVDEPGRDLSRGQLAAAGGVLTGCALGIAETGTVVLDGGVAQGRRALTLLPDYHLCVIGGSQVVATVPEALAALVTSVRERRAPLTFISGPSATSDIELARVEGVHGPRTLDVLLVEDA